MKNTQSFGELLLQAFDDCAEAERNGESFEQFKARKGTEMQPDEPDKYGNTEDNYQFCSFPDCGCDGARLCCAPSGASAEFRPLGT